MRPLSGRPLHGGGQRKIGGSSQFTPQSLFADGSDGYLFDPANLGTLWQDSGRTTAVSSNNDPVGYVDDLSGNSNDVSQAVSGSRPLYQTDGTTHFLVADGSNYFLGPVVYGSAMSQPWTRISALRQVSWTAGDRILGGGTNEIGILYQHGTTPTIKMYSGTINPTTTDLVVGTNGVVTEQGNGASSRIRVDQGSWTTANSGTNNVTGITLFASSTGANKANVRYYGGLMVAKLLSDAELADAEAYFAVRSGVSL